MPSPANPPKFGHAPASRSLLGRAAPAYRAARLSEMEEEGTAPPVAALTVLAAAVKPLAGGRMQITGITQAGRRLAIVMGGALASHVAERIREEAEE